MNDDTQRSSNGRFQKGTCPNPKGRPRKDRSVSSAILAAAHEVVTANDRGRKRKMRKLDLTASQFANKGSSGDHRAGKALLDYVTKAEQQLALKASADVPLTVSDREIAEAFLTEYRRSLGLEA